MPFYGFSFSGISVQNEPQDTLAIVDSLVKTIFPESEVIQLEKGDLNMDGKEDIAAIITRPCDEGALSLSSEDSPVQCRRLVLIVMREEYTVVMVNDDLIDCSKCGSGLNYRDAFDELYIDNGKITIVNSYGACQREFITDEFTYSKKQENWYRTGRHVEVYDCNVQDEEGEIQMTKEIIEKPSGWKKEWIGIMRRPKRSK